MRSVSGATGSTDILSAGGRSPLQLVIYKNPFSKEFALRAQADKMSALPIAPGVDLVL
ncbi:MAG TPA: hypothetical protein VN956_22545 [Pyrinomonadaceae bacterium]|nr:hypothetical protein [Pyrinomonadaceae bacterium]